MPSKIEAAVRHSIYDENYGIDVESRSDTTEDHLAKEQNLLDIYSTLNDTMKIRQQFLDCIESLLVRQKGKARYPDLTAILTALTMMQNNRDLLKTVERNRSNLRAGWMQPVEDFTQVLVRASVGSMNQTHVEIINTVKKTFERLYSDQRLGPVFKTLISQLQFPVLKLVFKDRVMFQKKDHPAALVFKKLIQAGAHWSAIKDFRSDPVYRETIRVVARIVDEFTDDQSIFEDLVKNSRLFTEEFPTTATADGARSASETAAGEEYARRRMADPQIEENQDAPSTRATPVPMPAVAAVHGEALPPEPAPATHAAAHTQAVSAVTAPTPLPDPVTLLVTEKLAGQALPLTVEEFLTGTWRMIMTKTRRLYGEQHSAWRMTVDVIDRIVWCYQPKRSPQEKNELKEKFPRLLLDIEDGLRSIMHHRREKENLVAELMQIYGKQLTEIYRYK